MFGYYKLRIWQQKDLILQQVNSENIKNHKFNKMITLIDIINVNAEQERQDLIRQLGIKLNSSWREIIKANDKRDIPIQSYPD